MEVNEINTMTLPVLPLRGMVVFPKAVIHFDVGRKQSIAAVNRAMKEDQLIFLAAQKDPVVNEPKLIDLYGVGVVAKVIQILRQPDDVTRVVLEGKYRAQAVAPVFDNKIMLADVSPIAEEKTPPPNRRVASGAQAEENTLIYETGKFIKKRVAIPFEKINTIDMGRNIFERLVGTCRLSDQAEHSRNIQALRASEHCAGRAG